VVEGGFKLQTHHKDHFADMATADIICHSRNGPFGQCAWSNTIVKCRTIIEGGELVAHGYGAEISLYMKVQGRANEQANRCVWDDQDGV